jgi:hypothetical protein
MRLPKNNILLLIVLTLSALILRLLWVFYIPNVPISDFEAYYNTAVSVYHGEGISIKGNPVSYQGMVYQLFLGVIFILCGSTDILVGKLANVVVSMLTLFVLYKIFDILITNKRYVYLGFGILCFLPNYIAYTNVIGTEILFTFLYSLVVLVHVSNLRVRYKYPLLGALIAITALTRPLFLAYPAVIIVVEWIRRKDWKQTVLLTTVIAVVMCAVLSPWVYRNYQKFDSLILVSYNGGVNIYINNNEQNQRGGYMPISAVEPTPKLLEGLQSVGAKYEQYNPKLEKYYRNAAVRWIVSNPLDFMKLGLLRIKLTFFNGANDIEMWTIQKDALVYTRDYYTFQAIAEIVFQFIVIGGFLFLLSQLRNVFRAVFSRRKVSQLNTMIPLINIFFFLGIYFVFEGQARYSFPALFLLVLATCFIMEKLEILKHK